MWEPSLWQLISKEIGIQRCQLHLNILEILRALRLIVRTWSTIWHRSGRPCRRIANVVWRKILSVSLDSKEKKTKAAVEMLRLSWTSWCRKPAHFDAVRQMLENLGVDYITDTNMVRGLDYYNYRFSSLSLRLRGNDLTVCAGGRCDGLAAYFGGHETAGFGFDLGRGRFSSSKNKVWLLPIEDAPDVLYRSLGWRSKC